MFHISVVLPFKLLGPPPQGGEPRGPGPKDEPSDVEDLPDFGGTSSEDQMLQAEPALGDAALEDPRSQSVTVGLVFFIKRSQGRLHFPKRGFCQLADPRLRAGNRQRQ